MIHFIQLVSQASIFNLLGVLLSSPSVDFNIHLPDLSSEACHHEIVLLALLLQAMICSFHVVDFVTQLGDFMLHVTNLISKMSIFTLNMPQPFHLDFDIVQLASPAIVIILRPVGLKKLLSEHLDLIFGSIGPLELHLSSIFSCGFVSLRQIDHLLVMCPLLRSLQLQSAPLLLEISLDAIAFLS